MTLDALSSSSRPCATSATAHATGRCAPGSRTASSLWSKECALAGSPTRPRSAPRPTGCFAPRPSDAALSSTMKKGFFSWEFDEKARRYDEELLCGRYVITTSLSATEASAAQVVRYSGVLSHVERRFRVMKDFLSLRPMFHWSEERVRGHVGLCVLAATIEAVMAKDLVKAKVMDPDLPFQSMTPRRALALLKEVHIQHLAAGTQQIKLVNRRNALQAKVLKAFRVDTSTWSKAEIA